MKKGRWKKILASILVLGIFLLGAAWIAQLLRGTAPAWAPVRLEGRQVILDAGHGGEDGGAVSITGVPESQINLATTLKLDQILGFCGIAPILTRDRDISIYDPGCDTLREKKVSDIHNRVALIEETSNALLVSIHQNTFSNAAYHGAQVFYREDGESQVLAAAVQEKIRTGADPDNRRTPVKIPDTVYLMKHITCPAVLVECGFLSNRAEEEKLRSGGYQTKIALCVASALLTTEKNSGETCGPVV